MIVPGCHGRSDLQCVIYTVGVMIPSFFDFPQQRIDVYQYQTNKNVVVNTLSFLVLPGQF